MTLLRKLAMSTILVASMTSAVSAHADETKKSSEPAKAAAAEGDLRPSTDEDAKNLKSLDKRYQNAPSVTMKVDKTLKLGLLNDVRKSKGNLTLSSGRVRMELEGDEKSLLVINKKNFWAVTFPPADFKDAPVQVITGQTGTKKARSQSLLGVLSQGGFLEFFSLTGVKKLAAGEIQYFLQPKSQTSEFKRAQLTVSSDGKEIRELRYWDERDNETQLSFNAVTFGKKVSDKAFTYSPPAKAEIMKM